MHQGSRRPRGGCRRELGHMHCNSADLRAICGAALLRVRHAIPTPDLSGKTTVALCNARRAQAGCCCVRR